MDNPRNRSLSRRGFLELAGVVAVGAGGAVFLTRFGPAPQNSVAGAKAAVESGSSLGDGKTLRVGMEAAYAPYNWQVGTASEHTIPIDNVSGAYADGYDVQAAKIIAKALGMEAVAVKSDFGALIDSLNNGQIDIVCAGMSVTDERKKSADFSDSYIDDDIVMLVKKDSPYAGATRFSDLKGASIMGQASTMYDDVIAQIPEANHMTPGKTVPQVVESLSSGTSNVITFSKLSVPHLLKTYPDFVELKMTDKFEGSVMPDNAAIKKGHPEVLEKINRAIAGISPDERQKMWDACMERQPQ